MAAPYASPIVPLVLAMAALILRCIVRLPGGRHSIRAVWPTLAVVVAVHLATLGALSGVARNPVLVARRSAVASHARVSDRFVRAGGWHLVSVCHALSFQGDIEWVYKPPDLRAAKVLYAHDLGPVRRPRFVAAFPGRSLWMALLSREGVRLEPYMVAPDR